MLAKFRIGDRVRCIHPNARQNLGTIWGYVFACEVTPYLRDIRHRVQFNDGQVEWISEQWLEPYEMAGQPTP